LHPLLDFISAYFSVACFPWQLQPAPNDESSPNPNDFTSSTNTDQLPEAPPGLLGDDNIVSAISDLRAWFQDSQTDWTGDWFDLSFAELLAKASDPFRLPAASILDICYCTGILCSVSQAAKEFFQGSDLLQLCVDVMSLKNIQPFSTICIADQLLTSVYDDTALDNFDQILTALSNAGTMSSQHSERVARALVTIVDRPESAACADQLFQMVDDLARSNDSGLWGAPLCTIIQILVSRGPEYYGALIDRGTLGVLDAALQHELAEGSRVIWPEMLVLISYVCALDLAHDAPFGVDTARQIPPHVYMRSILACDTPQAVQVLDVLTKVLSETANPVPYLEILRNVVLSDAVWDASLAWLRAWYLQALEGWAGIGEATFSLGVIQDFSWLLDHPRPELEWYLGLILCILPLGIEPGSLGPVFFEVPTDSDDPCSVFEKIGAFLDNMPHGGPDIEFQSEITGEAVNLWDQAAAIYQELNGGGGDQSNQGEGEELNRGEGEEMNQGEGEEMNQGEGEEWNHAEEEDT
jgi:hypothetical protein